MGNIVNVFLTILTKKWFDYVEVTLNDEASAVVFVGGDSRDVLLELADILRGRESLSEALRATAELKGNARFIFHDIDEAVEIRLVDSFKVEIDDTVLYSPSLRMSRGI